MINEQKSSTFLIVFLMIVVAMLVGVSVFFWQKYENAKPMPVSNAISNTVVEVIPTPDSVQTPEPTPISDELSTDPKTPIVFVPSGLFTQVERDELITKLADPFIDFEKEQSGVYPASFTIEKYDGGDYSYKISYVFKNGGNGGFLYGTKTPLEWWLPECYFKCEFSPDFAEKYPELVKAYIAAQN